MRPTSFLTALGALVLVTGGCGTTQSTETAYVSSSLVMPGPGLTADHAVRSGDPDAWEYARNDPQLNAGVTPSASQLDWAEIRTHDLARTNNGRPREYSRTLVRTVRRRQLP